MPQAEKRLREKFPFPTGDLLAIDVLKASGFKDHKGLIYIHRKPTRNEQDAIDYLVQEWDWQATESRGALPEGDDSVWDNLIE